MHRTTRIAVIGSATLLVILYLGYGSGSDAHVRDDADGASDPYGASENSTMSGMASGDASFYERYNNEYKPRPDYDLNHQTSSGNGGTVVLVDQTLQMPISSFDVPAGWTVFQEIASHPTTGHALRYQVDVIGPQGELMRSLGVPVYYGFTTGISMHQAWQQEVMRGMQGVVEGLSLGNLQRSRHMDSSPSFQRTAQKGQQLGIRVEGLEASLSGRRNGQPVQGFVYITHFPSGEMRDSGMLTVAILISPPEHLGATLEVERRMAASQRPNPEHERRITQLSQQSTNLTLQQSRAQFDAHQENMRGRYAAGDQQSEGWWAGQRSNYESHRRTIHGINETADVYNHQTGQTHYGVQGGYNTYWVDQSGNVVGSQGYENPDPSRYQSATNLDDLNRPRP
jgi:hypothetical protein